MRHAILISDAEGTCGVEEFARQTAKHIDESVAVPLGQSAVADDVVINLPVVAWKKRLIAPITAAARARAAGRSVSIILHEWADLALARRLSYLPLLPLATRLFFSSPEVMAQFASTPISRVLTKARRVVAIPPNFAVPQWTRSTALADSLAADRAKGRLVLGQFGSIYPRKDPVLLLEAAAELVRRGTDIRAVFIGSFVGGAVESGFWEDVARLGLGDRVEVTGYIRSAEELYGVFAQVDAFLYPLAEGMTSRRASVQAAALSGRPVIVTAPARADSLAHHALLQALVATGTIRFVPLGADAGALADAVLATRSAPGRPIDVTRQIEAAWRDVAAALDA